jgi:hypothetical protein
MTAALAKRERIRHVDLVERRRSRSQFDEALPEDGQGTWSQKKLIEMDLKFCLAVLRSGELALDEQDHWIQRSAA